MALLFNLDPREIATGIPRAAFYDAIHADDRLHVRTGVERSAREGNTYLNEYRVISADGRTRCVLVRGHIIGDHAGRAVGGSGILVDITPMRTTRDMSGDGSQRSEQALLGQAAEHAIAAHEAILKLRDPKLKTLAQAFLMELGRRLAREEARTRRTRLN